MSATDTTHLAPTSHNALSNEFGHFDRETSEFIITNVLTPRPWANVMSNGVYGLVVSQQGGGFSWVDNSQLRRLTRWEQDLALDAYGRWLYIRDLDSGVTHSTTFAPVRELAESEEVRHGLGYTIFERKLDGISSKQTLFVPLTGSLEHSIVEISNASDTAKRLSLGSYVEWFLGSQGEWHREFHRLFISLEAAGNCLLAWKRAGLTEGTRELPESPFTAFAAVSGLEKVTWFADKAQFVGRMGRLDEPIGLDPDCESTITGRWDDPIAAFRKVVTLAPGESIKFAVSIGAEANRSEAMISAAATVEEIESRLAAVQKHYAERCGSLNIETADPAFDILNNAWLPHQAETGRMVARCAYYQQGGAYGFRDQLQDSLALLDSDPAAALKQLEIQSEAMYEDGGVRHWWHPNTDIYADSHHSDTCLWLAFGVLEYLDETADFGALEKPTRFLSRETKRFGRHGTLLDHCLCGIDHMLERRSSRGLPFIGAGDWNDGLSHAGLEGKGESVWLAMFGYGILMRMAEVLDRIGQPAKATRFRTEAGNLQTAVEGYAWDGDWYIAGTSDNGQKFGAHDNMHGQIFLNPQTWGVITGIAPRERSEKAMASVKDKLVKPYGALLLAPAYRNVDPYIGYITRYAPGLRENGGVYSHASTWAVEAFARLGDTKTAFAIFQGMMPPLRSAESAESYQAEPYVMPGNVDGPDSPYEGRGGWTWYTGSAAWMRRTALHWILGVRATLDGLIVEPQIPDELGNVHLFRHFRGDIFDITIEKGGKKLYVDGQLATESLIPASGLKKERKIVFAAE